MLYGFCDKFVVFLTSIQSYLMWSYIPVITIGGIDNKEYCSLTFFTFWGVTRRRETRWEVSTADIITCMKTLCTEKIKVKVWNDLDILTPQLPGVTKRELLSQVCGIPKQFSCNQICQLYAL